MKPQKILKITLPLALGGFLVWYSLTIVSPEKLAAYFKNANYPWVLLGLIFGILSHISRAYRWKFLLEPMGFKPKFVNSFLAVLVGYLVNLILPRAGEVSRAAIIANYEKVPFEKGFGTIVAERLADLLMLFLVILIALFIQFDFIWNLLIKNFNPLKIIGTLFLLIVGIFVVYKIIKKSSSTFAFKIKSFLFGLKEGLTSIFKMQKKWAFIVHTFFIWLMYIAMFWATIPAVDGLEIPFGGVLIGFIAGGFQLQQPMVVWVCIQLR